MKCGEMILGLQSSTFCIDAICYQYDSYVVILVTLKILGTGCVFLCRFSIFAYFYRFPLTPLGFNTERMVPPDPSGESLTLSRNYFPSPEKTDTFLNCYFCCGGGNKLHLSTSNCSYLHFLEFY